MKGLALNLTLKQRLKATRKWPIDYVVGLQNTSQDEQHTATIPNIN